MVTYRDLVSGLGARVETAFTAMKLARPLGQAFGVFPTKMVVDPSWLADPLSMAVLKYGSRCFRSLGWGLLGAADVDLTVRRSGRNGSSRR
jgi:hypothetical protein